MKSRSAWGVFVTTGTILGINLVPPGIVLLGGQPAEMAMVLYFLENLVSVFRVAVQVRTLAPAHSAAYSGAVDGSAEKAKGYGRPDRVRAIDRRTLLADFLLVALAFSAGTAVFLFFFLLVVLRTEMSRRAIQLGVGGIVLFQALGFVGDLFLHSPLSPAKAEALLEQSLGRVFLLYLAVFAGVFLALFVDRWFVLPFAVLKTAVDLAVPVQAAMKRGGESCFR